MQQNKTAFLPQSSEIEFITMRDGTTVRVGFFPAPGAVKGNVLLLNGHREYLEKYSEFIEKFQETGFNIYSLDHRGQGLSDRPLKNRNKSHNPDFNILVDDIDEYIKLKIKPNELQKPFYLVAHSLGAQLGLHFLHDHLNIFDKALLLSPFTELKIKSPFLKSLVKLFFKIAKILGFSNMFAFGQPQNRNGIDHEHNISVLTHDKVQYFRTQSAIDENPDLFISGVTYGWLNGAMNSISKLRKPRYMEEITTEILCLLAEEERVVDNEVTIELIGRLPNANVAIIKGARHEIYQEVDNVQEQLWHQIDEFLKP